MLSEQGLTATDNDMAPVPSPARGSVWKVLRLVIVGALVWMWVYAYFFAPRESINRIGDPQWSTRSEKTCAAARSARSALADLSRIDPHDPAVLEEKARIIDAATDTLDGVLNSLAADPPATEKGRELVPRWLADYRQYVGDRREYAASLRTGRISIFSETAVEGVPITERLAKFARENDMRSCQPPRDLQS